MAEKLTSAGLVVGLIPDEAEKKETESKPVAESQPKRAARKTKQAEK
jgi:hypothetical protein